MHSDGFVTDVVPPRIERADWSLEKLQQEPHFQIFVPFTIFVCFWNWDQLSSIAILKCQLAASSEHVASLRFLRCLVKYLNESRQEKILLSM